MRLIDADELQKAFTEECCGCCDCCSHSMTGYKCELIDNAPTVTPDKIQAIMSDYLVYRSEPQRPTGEWILDSVTPHSVSWFRCSYCGNLLESYKETNYCPNCGTKMKGENE